MKAPLGLERGMSLHFVNLERFAIKDFIPGGHEQNVLSQFFTEAEVQKMQLSTKGQLAARDQKGFHQRGGLNTEKNLRVCWPASMKYTLLRNTWTYG